ncbi:MAG: hypothetical protein AAF441_11060 [Pseudomonadota bacterium]
MKTLYLGYSEEIQKSPSGSARAANNQPNALDSLPQIMFRAFTNLETLSLTHGGLTQLPSEIANLQSLTTLRLEGNLLVAVPQEIGQLGALTTLSLSNNQLSMLPAEIGKLRRLVNLELQRNMLSAIPAQIGQLHALKSLNLCENELLSLPIQIGTLAALRLLALADNQLSALPREIGQLQALTRLDMSGNHLSALPREIGQLQALTRLDMSGNQLPALPREIGQLQALTELNLDDNQLSDLPEEVGQLQALTELSLDDNQLSALPREIGQLQALTGLYLDDNQLSALPREIGQPQALTTLYLRANQLSALPHEIGQLQALTTLHLNDNQLSALPHEIGQLHDLKRLHLRNNSLPDAYQATFNDGGIDALRALLEGEETRDQPEEPTDPADEEPDEASEALEQQAGSHVFDAETGVVRAVPLAGAADDPEMAETLRRAVRSKAEKLLANLKGNHCPQRLSDTIDELLRSLGGEVADINPGELLMSATSLDEDLAAYDGPEGRAELYPDAIAAMGDLQRSLIYLKAAFPAILKIEAAMLAQELRKPDVREALEHARAANVIAEQSAETDRSAVDAMAAPDAKIEQAEEIIATASSPTARAAAEEARMRHGGQKLLEVRNYSAAVLKAAGKGVLSGVEKTTQGAVIGGFAALAGSLLGPLAGLATLVAGFVPLKKEAEKIKRETDAKKEDEGKSDSAEGQGGD